MEFPKIKRRRPAYIKGYYESDDDYIKNNLDACVWFLDNHALIKKAIKKGMKKSSQKFF